MTKPNICETRDAKAARAAAAQRAAALNVLRQQVRANLAPMDETPAPPPPTREEIRTAQDRLWRKIARNAPTGRREKVAGTRDEHGNKTNADGLAATLRAIADFRTNGGTLQIRYHGERWQNVADELEYLRSLLPEGTQASRIRNVAAAIAA